MECIVKWKNSSLWVLLQQFLVGIMWGFRRVWFKVFENRGKVGNSDLMGVLDWFVDNYRIFFNEKVTITLNFPVKISLRLSYRAYPCSETYRRPWAYLIDAKHGKACDTTISYVCAMLFIINLWLFCLYRFHFKLKSYAHKIKIYNT